MANDFSGDPNCVALWRFEDSPGFTVDSQGSNDLTNDGADEENTYYKEGSQSAKFVNSNNDSMTIADADQDAGFPWRYADGGSVEKSYSINFWMRFITLPSVIGSYIYFISKAKLNGSILNCFSIASDGSNKLIFLKGYNSGASYEIVTFGTAFEVDKWYQIGVTYDSSTKGYCLRVWDDTANDFLDSDLTGNFTNATDLVDVPLHLGRRHSNYGWLDGYLDELVIFNRVISTDEIDAIRNGTFTFGGTQYQRSVSGIFLPTGALMRRAGFGRGLSGEI